MSTRTRRSLRAFDDEAIAAPEPTRVQPVAPATPPRGQTRADPAQAGSTTRAGIYLHPGTFEAAKSAYIADFDQSGPDAADTFARWIAGVLDRHAARTPAERAAVADELPEEVFEGSGINRSFDLPDATMAGMHAAITADRRAGRVTSRSQFCSTAIRSATEDARRRAGGELPPAPKRLPNKMR